MKKIRSSGKITLLGLIWAIVFSWASTCPAAPYSLGIALGLSGTGEPYSREALEGIELAVTEINAKGGLLGAHPIQLAIRDTRTEPEIAKKVVQELIESEKVLCVIGTYSSATALAVKPLLRKARTLHIAPVSNSEQITMQDPSPYTFSVVPNTYMMAKGAVLGVAALAREKGWTKYATIASNYAWGQSSQQVQVDQLKAVAPNIELVGAYWPKLGQTRFNSFIVDIQARKPDFVLSSIAGADNRYWMRDARDYRLFKTVAHPGGLISLTELIEQASSIRRGTYGRCRAPFFAHLDVPLMAAFVASYRHRYGRYPSDWAVLGYDAVQVLKQGVTKAGSIETQQVRNAMQGMTVQTTRGQLFFRKIDNQLSCSVYFGRVADDPGYPFPIYHGLIEIKAPRNWRPEKEILDARSK
ncbi:MAG: ABC transporter substrate-binding protein [Desulfobacteraceae bacterium]|jgi:branched-chain amino acid transport system substrate-binding protein